MSTSLMTASRFTELRGYLAAELARINQAPDDTRRAITTRLEQLHQEHRSALDEATNSLSAYIGQLEDRLERAHVLPADPDRPALRDGH